MQHLVVEAGSGEEIRVILGFLGMAEAAGGMEFDFFVSEQDGYLAIDTPHEGALIAALYRGKESGELDFPFAVQRTH